MSWLVWLKQFANKYLGGYARPSYYDEILEFDPLYGQWKLLDRRIQERANHAVAVIIFDSGLCVV